MEQSGQIKNILVTYLLPNNKKKVIPINVEDHDIADITFLGSNHKETLFLFETFESYYPYSPHMTYTYLLDLTNYNPSIEGLNTKNSYSLMFCNRNNIITCRLHDGTYKKPKTIFTFEGTLFSGFETHGFSSDDNGEKIAICEGEKLRLIEQDDNNTFKLSPINFDVHDLLTDTSFFHSAHLSHNGNYLLVITATYDRNTLVPSQYIYAQHFKVASKYYFDQCYLINLNSNSSSSLPIPDSFRKSFHCILNPYFTDDDQYIVLSHYDQGCLLYEIETGAHFQTSRSFSPLTANTPTIKNIIALASPQKTNKKEDVEQKLTLLYPKQQLITKQYSYWPAGFLLVPFVFLILKNHFSSVK